MPYLCSRKQGARPELDPETVPWMSGLVSGLQNRPQQFESARHLHKNEGLDVQKRGKAFFLVGY